METKTISIYLESGQKRVIAGALDWPGWIRAGRNAEEAIAALLAAAPRYAAALARSGMTTPLPTSPADFTIRERLPGDSSTDYGVPGAVPEADRVPVDGAALAQLQAVLTACWAALDAAAAAAAGHELRKGPRGGGRDLEKILAHVRDANLSYLSSLGVKASANSPEELHAAVFAGMAASARGELPAFGPRGGARWLPRYFTRRAAWHILDHAWEIEDRLV
jgi:hypothetical protein